MHGVHDLGLFVATVLVLNATPGVDMAITASRTLQHGLRGGLATAFGVSAGCVVHTLAAAFGLAALLATSAAAFAAIKWVGAAYLLWLAFGMLRAAIGGAGTRADVAPTAGAPDAAALFRQGLLTNLLNPKIALFFLALLPQFIAVEAPDKSVAFLFLGAVMLLQSTLFLALFVVLVARLRRHGASPRVRRGAQGAGGLVLLGLAASALPTEIGESCSLVVRLDDAAIRAGARLLADLNPLHHDLAAARAAGYPGLIASGAHTGAIFMGMTATHFSAASPSGAARSVLGLGFDIRFRAAVFADEELTLRWTVAESVWKDSLAGFVTRALGEVHSPRGLALTGVATLLLRHA